MENYQELYYFLVSGMSELIDSWLPISAEGEIAKSTLTSLLLEAEDRCLSAGVS